MASPSSFNFVGSGVSLQPLANSLWHVMNGSSTEVKAETLCKLHICILSECTSDVSRHLSTAVKLSVHVTSPARPLTFSLRNAHCHRSGSA